MPAPTINTFRLGDRARYTARWLRSTCSHLDADGTNGWATVTGTVDRRPGRWPQVVVVLWPNGTERRVLASNLQRRAPRG